MSKGFQWVECTGDACSGDIIKFDEVVWSRDEENNPSPVGKRTLIVEILRESYGQEKQQHTFVLEVLECSGTDPIPTGKIIRRMGRNIYRYGTERLLWSDEQGRQVVLNEKHARGAIARRTRDKRKLGEYKVRSLFLSDTD